MLIINPMNSKYSNKNKIDAARIAFMKKKEEFIKKKQAEISFEKGFFNDIDFFIERASKEGLNYALEWTSYWGKVDLVKKVLDKDADINANKSIALQMSCENGHIDVVKFLLEKGANINANNGAPLFNAVSNNHIDIVKFLLENKDANNNICNINENYGIALRMAITNNNCDIAKILIDHGADIKVFDGLLLEIAKKNNNTDIINLLC